jgi:hypothetical protein
LLKKQRGDNRLLVHDLRQQRQRMRPGVQQTTNNNKHNNSSTLTLNNKPTATTNSTNQQKQQPTIIWKVALCHAINALPELTTWAREWSYCSRALKATVG